MEKQAQAAAGSHETKAIFRPKPKVRQKAEMQPVNRIGLNLITQYYVPENSERSREIDYCLFQNLNNPLISTCYLLTETNLENEVKRKFSKFASKLVCINVKKRLSYSMGFEFANTSLRGAISILCNADIYYDQSLEKLHDVDMSNRVFALLRYETGSSGNTTPSTYPNTEMPRHDSQDTWVFQAPINLDMESASIELGRGGCDNRIARVLNDSTVRLSNPSRDIRSFHVHSSVLERSWKSAEVKGPYCFLTPGTLRQMDDRQRILDEEQYLKIVEILRRKNS